eukprot:GHRR01029282.1.p2 GENE.GHRR01029282.1~~GHRR01029282.1.p2  ORF type:complete len:111 (+),score=33.75 GHRR01029282.1:342-674(+)
MAAARSLGRLQKQSTSLFICDIQERFRPIIAGMPAVVDTARRMIRGANILGLPVIVTEQYPKALGNTVRELKEVLQPKSPIISKTRFSMVTDEVSQLLKGQQMTKQASKQ